MALERYVLPVKARPVVPSAIHSFTSPQPVGSTGCAHFEEGMAKAVLETVDEGVDDVDVDSDWLVVDCISLDAVAIFEVDSASLVVDETVEDGDVVKIADVGTTEVCADEPPLELRIFEEATLEDDDAAVVGIEVTAELDATEVNAAVEEVAARLEAARVPEDVLTLVEGDTAPDEVPARLVDVRVPVAVLALVRAAEEAVLEVDEDAALVVAAPVPLATTDVGCEGKAQPTSSFFFLNINLLTAVLPDREELAPPAVEEDTAVLLMVFAGVVELDVVLTVRKVTVAA